MKKTIDDTNKAKINALMRVLKVRNFNQIEILLDCAGGTITRVFHGKIHFSHRLFLRTAILLDMKPSELMEKLGIDKDYFFDIRR